MYETKYLFENNNSINNEIIIVDIDNDSLWIKDRPDYLADVIKLIAEKGKAEVIGVDILFDDLKNPDPERPTLKHLNLSCPYDKNKHPLEMKLACTLQEGSVSNVVLAATIKKMGGLSLILYPIKALKESAWAVGSILFPLDKGDYNHHKASIYYEDCKNNYSYSFPILIASYIKGAPSLTTNELVIGKNKIKINYSPEGYPYFIPDLLGPNKMFKYVTMSELFHDKSDHRSYEKLFKGKIVLIGSSSEILDDLINTPLTRFNTHSSFNGRMPGVEFHANSVYSLLHNKTYHLAPPWINVIWAFLFILVSSMSMLYFRSSYSFLLNIFTAIACFILGFYIFLNYSTILSVGTTITIILLIIPFAYFYKYLTVDRFFGRYVSPDVSDLIWKNREQLILKGEKKLATVVFTDIRGFTTLSENADPEKILEILNDYFEKMADVIYKTHGNLNKFIGDGLMILYGVPISYKDTESDAKNAIDAAILMLKEVELLNNKWAHEGKSVKIAIGVGIHTGEVIAGNIGAAKRMEYSAIGDTVNLASRLESTNKEFNTNIIVSETTYNLVKNHVKLKSLGNVKVKGRAKEINIFTIDNSEENK